VRSPGATAQPKLSELEVTKTQSSRWQRLAALPDKDFEAVIDRAKRKAVSALDGAGR
jgi:hypothetical protein